MARDRESILETIRRLMALGSSPNEHEAKLALAKAAELMAEHNIATADVDAATAATNSRWHAKNAWQGAEVPFELEMIIPLVQEFFFVEAVEVRRADSTTFELFGDRTNIDVAVYVLNYLLEAFRSAAAARKMLPSELRSYYIGLTTVLVRRMREERAELERRSEKPGGLVVIKNQLTTAFKQAYGELPTAQPTPAIVTAGAFFNGCLDGQQIELKKGIAGPAPEPTKPLLTDEAG